MGELAQWKCHKIVKAGKITAVRAGSGFHGKTITVEDVSGAPCEVEMPDTAFSRGDPVIGDYVVIYEDGYKSWSPAKAFEEGYARI